VRLLIKRVELSNCTVVRMALSAECGRLRGGGYDTTSKRGSHNLRVEATRIDMMTQKSGYVPGDNNHDPKYRIRPLLTSITAYVRLQPNDLCLPAQIPGTGDVIPYPSVHALFLAMPGMMSPPHAASFFACCAAAAAFPGTGHRICCCVSITCSIP